MSEYPGIITRDEAAILEQMEKDASKLKERLEEIEPALSKHDFAKFSTEEKEAIIKTVFSKDIFIFSDINDQSLHYYQTLKGQMDKNYTTHEFITEQALGLLGINDKKMIQSLKDACVEPDRKKNLWELAYEGHFYGKTKGNKYGNFLPRVFGGAAVRILHCFDKNIEETAQSNFIDYYQKSIKNSIDLTRLGWAIHYLQDMTAPHHAGNMALFFEIFTDGTNSHFPFEKYAREYVYEPSQDFRDSAQIHYNDLRPLG